MIGLYECLIISYNRS